MLCWIVDVYLLTQRSLTAAVVVVVLPNISDVYYLQSGRKQEEEGLVLQKVPSEGL